MEKHGNKVIEYLIEKGRETLKKPSGKILPIDKKTDDELKEACKLVEDIKNHPHFFLLFCVVNRGILAEAAIKIPYKVSKILNAEKFSDFLNFKFEDYQKIFNENIKCRYKNLHAKAFYLAIERIHEYFNDDASNIWNDNPSSKTAVKKFREFWGVGQKISTMAANILVRQFGIRFKDLKGIDISVDVHIVRIFKRTGILKDEEIQNLSRARLNNLIIKKAREIYPEYPGILDIEGWKIGKEICHENSPDCNICPLSHFCPRI